MQQYVAQVLIKYATPTASCPVCQITSQKVHSYYTRTVTDLCWTGLQARLELRVRRFVCSNTLCARRTFAERLGEQIKAYARRTKRCETQLQNIGLQLGGNAGARLAHIIGLPVSSDSLLRLVRTITMPQCTTPEVLGIDDFALRKGVQYGTILVDVEHHCLVDLLPDREKATVIAWLKDHPGIKIISRDRGMTYAEAAREALPKAIQIADRFHLSQNLGETLERLLRRQYPSVQEIFGQLDPVRDPSLPLKRWEAEKQISQERRIAIYERVVELDAQGYNQTEIAERLRISRQKVRQLLKGPPQPPIYKQRSTKLAPYKSYLTRRFVEERCENSLQLYREIYAQGYDGCRSVITNYVSQLRQHHGRMALTGRQPTTQPKPLKEGLPLPGSLRWWFHLPPEHLSVRQQGQLMLLCQSNAELAMTYQLAQEFAILLRGRKEEDLSGWLKRVYESAIAELVSFAKGLERDEAAVRAGLSLPWSQGPVEGAVNRLKLIKRSMYGRAKFDLLRIRVLCAA